MEEVKEEKKEEQVEGSIEKNKKNTAKNYVYNLLYNIFLLIVPLITTPYVSRVLAASGVGQYSFVFSLTTYFTMFGALGFTYYAQREIARYQDDKKKQTLIFWEIFICKIVSVGLAMAVNLTLVFTGVYGDNTQLMLIATITIGATLFDISFLFQGNEHFGIIVIRNIVFRIVGIVCIFVFVKKPSDLWLYALIQALIVIASNISLWISLPKYLVKFSPKELSIKRHILPTLRLFIPTVAISVYTVLDRTLIGIMIPGTVTVIEDNQFVVKTYANIENGYYEQAEKIVKMCMVAVTSLSAVMIPKNSSYFQKGMYEEVKNNIYKAISFAFFLGFPVMFGLAAVAMNFSPWFFGPGYDTVPYLIMMFSPLIIFIGLSGIFGNQYLIPAGKDGIFTLSVVFGSVINLGLNLVLIRYYWSIGAVIASVISEIAVMTFQYIYLRKIFSLKRILLSGVKYLILGAIMFAVVFPLNYFVFSPTIYNTLILVAIGMVVYVGLLFLTKDKMLYMIIDKVKSKFARKA